MEKSEQASQRPSVDTRQTLLVNQEVGTIQSHDHHCWIQALHQTETLESEKKTKTNGFQINHVENKEGVDALIYKTIQGE